MSLPGGALLLRLGDDQLFDRLQVLLEVVLSSVVTLELDLIDYVLSRLLQAQVFDEVLESEAMLLIDLGLFNLLVNHLLPSYVARVGHVHLLLHDVESAEEGWAEVARAEALRLDIDWHVGRGYRLLLDLRSLRHDLWCNLTINRLIICSPRQDWLLSLLASSGVLLIRYGIGLCIRSLSTAKGS